MKGTIQILRKHWTWWVGSEIGHFSLLTVPKRLYTKSCVFSPILVTSSFAFCVITFEPIEVQTCSAPQNDRLDLVFVKDDYVNSRKLARNGRKTAIYLFVSSQVQKNIFAFCVITFEPIEVQSESQFCERYLCRW
jgi:hypothetical protein